MCIYNEQRSVSELEAATGEKKGGGDVSGVRSFNFCSIHAPASQHCLPISPQALITACIPHFDQLSYFH